MKKLTGELFEIHITGDESIHNVCKGIGLKTISIDLLNPDFKQLRRQHMTSQVGVYKNYEHCKDHVDLIVKTLQEFDVNVIRAKIESPCYDHYMDRSLYLEVHTKCIESICWPMSVNINKTIPTPSATVRTYDKKEFDSFQKKYGEAKCELCLYDSFVDEDKDWFDLYDKEKMIKIVSKIKEIILKHDKKERYNKSTPLKEIDLFCVMIRGFCVLPEEDVERAFQNNTDNIAWKRQFIANNYGKEMTNDEVLEVQNMFKIAYDYFKENVSLGS